MNMRVWAVVLAAALAASMAVSAPSAATDEIPGAEGPTRATGSTTFGGSSPGRAAKNLATKITTSEMDVAVAATRGALGWGGITVREPGVVHVKPKGPRAALFVTPLEALNLALEARQRGHSSRMTLAEYAQMMKRFGFPFNKGAPGKQMVRFLKLWVAQAKKRTKDPRSFTPLFLHHMARAQVPPVNLATGNYHPDELRLSLLEIELLSAAFMRVKVKGVFPKAAARSTRTASEPCTWIEDSLKQDLPLGGDAIRKQGISMLIGEGLDKALEKAFTAKKAKAVDKILKAAKIASIISKLIGLYGTVMIYVEPHNPTGGDHYKIHKPIAQQNVDADHRHQFMAIAGLADEDWAAYQKEIELLGQTMSQLGAAAKDCLEFLGIPTIPDVGDFAKDLTKWKVTWSPTHDTAHSVVDVENSKFDFPGHFGHMLRRISDYQGAAVMVARVRAESAGAHKNGKLKRTDFVARASLDMSDTPSLGTFIDAMTGPLGLAASIAELSAGWLMSMAQPKAHNGFEIEYHEESCPFRTSQNSPQSASQKRNSAEGRPRTSDLRQVECRMPPGWTGTGTGEFVFAEEDGTPIGTETFEVKYRLEKTSDDEDDAAGFAMYEVTQGTASLTRNFGGRCTQTGTGSFDDVGGSMFIAEYMPDPDDYYSHGLNWVGSWTITTTCPEGATTRMSYDSWLVTTKSQPWVPGTTALSGSTSYKITDQSEDITVNWSWTLAAD